MSYKSRLRFFSSLSLKLGKEKEKGFFFSDPGRTEQAENYLFSNVIEGLPWWASG